MKINSPFSRQNCSNHSTYEGATQKTMDNSSMKETHFSILVIYMKSITVHRNSRKQFNLFR